MATLFDPYSLKDVALRNRIVVSPMCQYMSQEGVATDWHQVHYAALARGGAALVIVEATAVSPEGRITWADAGLWNDRQAEALVPIVESIKTWGAVPGIQLAHAGRKASANRPWEGDDHIPEGQPNSWTPLAPSAIAFGANLPRIPRELTVEEIARIQSDVVQAAERARDIGFEWLQLHFAHGYLAQNFWSTWSNKRTDQYGGSAENRGRYLLETLNDVRHVWPERLPLTARFGVVEFDGQDEQMISDSIDLLNKMKLEGLDSVDVSIGFNTPTAKIPWGPNFLADIAARVLKETGLPGTTSWFIDGPKGADDLIRSGKIDFATLARPFLANPHWPYYAAKELGMEQSAQMTLPPPYAHWLARYR
ncbi:MAG TPA: NADH:flavin oxidoreductase/NADH oxidase [Pirellulaceae bacterium]|nr:NADH:flavin oxidoreductase/NADH oxidase [Pirellulaceae bacterium]HMO91251.1 NADH:flavin oxidoreductase/NADH oxidase [Pirellulaceae bacterium]HMP68565.1 NADH:flavin oxidoreductase/NADH oxidase [Pirellulaceae bacterium]